MRGETKVANKKLPKKSAEVTSPIRCESHTHFIAHNSSRVEGPANLSLLLGKRTNTPFPHRGKCFCPLKF